MTIKKFDNHQQAAAKMYLYDNGAITLISYSTPVATIDEKGWLTINGLYSRTTIKHIGWFMRSIGSSYQTAKALYEDNKMMNILTGEILARA